MNSYISVNSPAKQNTQRHILQEILDAKHENYETYRSRSRSSSPVGKNFGNDRSNQKAMTVYGRASTPNKVSPLIEESPTKSLNQAALFHTQDERDYYTTEIS